MLAMGIGAVVHILMQFVHPPKNIRIKHLNQGKGHCMERFVVTTKCVKKLNQGEQTVTTLRCDEFDNTSYMPLNTTVGSLKRVLQSLSTVYMILLLRKRLQKMIVLLMRS